MQPKCDKKADKLAEKLGIDEEEIQIELNEVPEVESKGTEIDILEDYAFVRQKLLKIIVRAEEVLDTSVIGLKTLPNPSMIESTSHLLKTVSEASKSMIDLHKEIATIEEKRQKIKNMKGETKEEKNEEKQKATLKDIVKLIKSGNE